ncbi:MAG: DUF4349 domain-containing protein [Myxococcales bacterium]|nr:DUF4349 domain-containing protein [Myxococcales bacterium]
MDVAPAPELVRTADAEIHREDPAQGVTAAVALAKEHGGWAESMNVERVVLRVPDEQLDAVLVELPKLGEVASRRVHAVEMGDAHRDLRLRIDSLRRTRDRYLELLGRAENVSEATGVEREIERVTSELERLEAQLAAMEKRIQFSALALDFSRKVRPGPVGWVFYGLYSGLKWLLVWD